eukprot:4118020-Pyramimonas_sp.AAC.1
MPSNAKQCQETQSNAQRRKAMPCKVNQLQRYHTTTSHAKQCTSTPRHAKKCKSAPSNARHGQA